MIYLVLAILCSTMISVFMRIGKKYVNNQMGMFAANYVLCIVLSLCYIKPGSGMFGDRPMTTVILGIVTGALYLAGFLFLNWNIRNNGIVLSATFSKLGVLIPTLIAIVFFREMPNVLQVIGICLSVAAILLLHFEAEESGEEIEERQASENDSSVYTAAKRKQNNARSLKKYMLLLLMVQVGMNDSMSNLYEQLGDPKGSDGYLFLTFGTAFLIALLLTFVGGEKLTGKDILWGVLVGLPNYYSARFLLLSLGQLPAVVVYPTYSVAGIICIAVAGVAFFGEKISKRKWAVLAVIIAALCLLNL